MHHLHVDIETYSSVNLKKAGLYKYADSPDFEILLFSYKINKEPTKCVDLASGEEIPVLIIDMLFNPNIFKKAWNAAFEMYCIAVYLWRKYPKLPPLPLDQWECIMIKAAYNGLTFALDLVGRILNISKEKFGTGKDLIRFFCIPRKPTKTDTRLRNFFNDDPQKWRQFKKYNIRDVDAEAEIDERLIYSLPEFERRLYAIDIAINQFGVQVDKKLVAEIMSIDAQYQQHLINRACDITNLANPKSVQQLKKWLTAEIGVELEDQIGSLNKKGVEKLLSIVDDLAMREVLFIRQELALSSIKKYASMANTMNPEGIIRGLFQFYGANRTGRWAGRQVQVHNLARQKYKLSSLAQFRDFIKAGCDFELLALFESKGVAHIFKELCRTAFIPRPGKKFIIADYSAIEAVVISWLSGEAWKMEVFKTHGKLYEATASRMLKVPIEDVTEEQRQVGKVAELSLGYQGAVNALIKMGALDMGMKEEDLPRIVRLWRNANSKIVQFWYDCQNAFYAALETPGRSVTWCRHLLSVRYKSQNLELTLPSGRILFYRNARLMDGPKGDIIVYQGVDQNTKKWANLQIYGGKITENIVQAASRDILAGAIVRIHPVYPVPMHIHDEIVAEVPKDDNKALKFVENAMKKLPDWGKGLPLNVKAFQADFYRKN